MCVEFSIFYKELSKIIGGKKRVGIRSFLSMSGIKHKIVTSFHNRISQKSKFTATERVIATLTNYLLETCPSSQYPYVYLFANTV